MKKLLLVSLTSIFAVAFVLPAFAGPEESLEVRVSSTLVSISLSPETVDFGTLSAGEEKEASVTPVVKNEGSVTVNLDMKGTDAMRGDSRWVLSGTSNGVDQYMLKASKGTTWESGTLNLTTDYQEFFYSPSFTKGTDQNFHMKVLMPEIISVPGEYTANIYIRATQSGT